MGERKRSLFERDAVDGELLHCRLADAHVGDHGLHLPSLALQHHIQTAGEPETLIHTSTSMNLHLILILEICVFDILTL